MLNLQTERLDNHKAQLTVEVEAAQFNDAKRKAARRISRRVRIKGFRKGKAPYRLVAQYVGEAAIIEEAVELLGSDIYPQALEESEIMPYGPGSLEDFKIEPAPTFTFSVALQPEVDLKDFADVRLDFEAPLVTDEEVDAALEKMRLRAIEVLDDELDRAAAGNRVTVDIHSEFSDGEEAEEDDEERNGDDDDAPAPRQGDEFLHQRDLKLILDPEKALIMNGFAEALIGAELGANVNFELTVPPDENYEAVAGRKVTFDVKIKQIEAIRVPALDDEFARKMGEDRGDAIHNLDELRQSEREELEQDASEDIRREYSEEVLEKIIEGADIAFPAEMLEEYIDDLLDRLDQDLRRQGMNLENFIRITGTARETLREEYRDRAAVSLRRDLTLREFAAVQDVEISNEQVEESLNGLVGGLGDDDQYRNFFDTPQMRRNIASRLLMDQIRTHLCAIGQGEDIDKALEEHEARIKADNEKMRRRTARRAKLKEEESETAAEAKVDDAPGGGEAEVEAEISDVLAANRINDGKVNGQEDEQHSQSYSDGNRAGEPR